VVKLADIWQAYFPYSDGPGDKFRPVLVVGVSPMGSGQEQVVLAAMISSQVQKRRIGDVVISDWAAVGLTMPSLVKARRLASLSPSQFNDPAKYLGRLDDRTFSSVLAEIAVLFSP
jgi:mRNA-degrading endonuclease toxin of MazEF toxin-antitoxin module